MFRASVGEAGPASKHCRFSYRCVSMFTQTSATVLRQSMCLYRHAVTAWSCPSEDGSASAEVPLTRSLTVALAISVVIWPLFSANLDDLLKDGDGL